MADQKELIKRAEAEFENTKPTVLSSKRSAFLNKVPHLPICPEISTIQPEPEQLLAPTHWFRICSTYSGLGWQPVPPNPPGCFGCPPYYLPEYYSFNWLNNPLNPLYQNGQEAFYQLIISQLGSLNVGDVIEFDQGNWPVCLISFPYPASEIVCMEYLGFINDPGGGSPNSQWMVLGALPDPPPSPTYTFSLNSGCCDSVSPTSCYNIGDIGPEGGIIFSIPGVGPNTSTNMYYEVMQNDIAVAGTPNNCFNDVCGDEQVTYLVTNGSATHQQIDDNEIHFFWNPTVPYPGVGSNPPPQIGDTLTAVTPNLFTDAAGNPISATTITALSPTTQPTGQGPFTITIADQFTPAINPSGLNAMPFKFNITTIQTASCGNFGILGSEWGAYEIAPPAIQTLTDFGTGLDNTDNIDAFNQCPPPFACHPVIDTHDIAATLCKQQPTSSGPNDWFLPSAIEFKEMVTQVGPQLGLNPLGQNSEHLYWTSSQYKHNPLAPIQDPDKYSWSWDADTNSFKLAWRCHALSVRPIRSFECEIPVDEGIDYDYRIDTFGNNSVGTIGQLYNPYSVAGDIHVMYHTGPSYMFSALNNSYSTGSVNIGANSIAIMFNRSLTHSVDPAALPGLIQPDGLLPSVGDAIFNIVTPDPNTGGAPWQLSLGLISQVVLNTDPQWASTFQSINTSAPAGGFYGAGAAGVYQWSDPANNIYNYYGHEPFDHSIIIDTILIFDTPISGGKGAQQLPQNQTGYIPASSSHTYDTINGSYMGWQQYPPGTRFGEGSPNLNHGLRFQAEVPNNMYSPSIFGSTHEIGHDYLKFVNWNRYDVRYNDLHGLSSYPDRLDGYANEVFNIKIYSQYEELLGDWDYKLKDRHGGYGCCVAECRHRVMWEKMQTNYVNPLYSSHPDVVDLSVYHEGLTQAGHPEGWAYVSITCETDPTWNSGMTRGNTLNLEDWRGTGQNNRTKDNTYPVSGIQWKWQKEVCGGNSAGGCCRILCGRYKAELNPPTLNLYCYAFNSATPNHTVLFNNKNDCIVGGVSIAGGGTQAKLIGPSEKYPDDINQCFYDGEEVDIYISSQKQYDENVVMSKRQKFINSKILPIKELPPVKWDDIFYI